MACLTFRLICCFFVRGPRSRALGVDSGPRGWDFEGVLDPLKYKNSYFFQGQKGAYDGLNQSSWAPVGPDRSHRFGGLSFVNICDARVKSAADGLGFMGLVFSDVIEHRPFWGSGRSLGL